MVSSSDLKFYKYQLCYGPDSNAHVKARNYFLDNYGNNKRIDKIVEETGTHSAVLFKDAVDFFIYLEELLRDKYQELEDQGLNPQDVEFTDRLLADVNNIIKEVYHNDVFLP